MVVLRLEIDGRPATWGGRFVSAVKVGGAVAAATFALSMPADLPSARWVLRTAGVAWVAGTGCTLVTLLIDLGGPVSRGLRLVTILLVAFWALVSASSVLSFAEDVGAWH